MNYEIQNPIYYQATKAFLNAFNQNVKTIDFDFQDPTLQFNLTSIWSAPCQVDRLNI